jgi:glycosyltransferase involved in cell wall biosynthesis
MNILYLSSKKRWGGVVSWMQKSAIGLEKKGHNIFIISHPKSMFTNLSAQSLKIIPYRLGSEYSLLSIFFLVKFIKKNKIDLLVTNLEKEVGIGGIAAKLCKIPNIRRVGREDDFKNKLKNKLNHKHLVTRCIVPCNYVREIVINKYSWLLNSDLITIYNGRNLKIFSKNEIEQIRNSWAVKKNELVIGITSQLLPVKRIVNLISVFAKLVKTHDYIKLVITGTGKEFNNLQKQTLILNVREKVVFPGFTNEPLLTAAGYDIAVLNSSIEGFPNSIIEYLSVGKPVVSTNVGGVNEIIRNGYNGSLITSGDDELLYKKINELIINKKTRELYSKNAFLSIMDIFSEDEMINNIESFFKTQLSLYAKKKYPQTFM